MKTKEEILIEHWMVALKAGDNVDCRNSLLTSIKNGNQNYLLNAMEEYAIEYYNEHLKSK